MSENLKMLSFSKIEKKWQKKWEEKKAFLSKDRKGSKKFYIMEMYPFPSGYGLHMGHAFNYSIGDIQARLRRMQGFNVLYPMGFDSFGLPAENAAIKEKSHPKKFTDEAIKNYIKQMKELGLSYDWSRKVESHDPEYYKWDQWIFLKMLERGLAYRKNAAVNFCPKCNTVLANEQVINGKCWRHEETDVEIRHLEQWFLKITDYADELYEGIEKLGEWPDLIRKMQKNWIGKSSGTEIDFEINGEKWKVFTTRPDTLFGVTFLVVSAQHPDLLGMVSDKQVKEVQKFLKKIKSTKEEDMDKMEKEGVFTGSYAIHPLTKEKIPVYAGNFVVADYGSGIVMGVPAHDQRDFEFAKKYSLEVKDVIRPFFGELKENAEFRNTISAVIHRKKDNKFLLLKWKGFGWVSPSIGGIEKGENLEKAAIREVLEETGYKTKFIKKLGGEIESCFFAENKKVWRHRVDQPVLLELVGDKPLNINNEEKNKHEVIWLSTEEALKQISHEINKYGILRYLGKSGAYTGYGNLVNSGAFDGLTSDEAKEHILKALEAKGKGRKVVRYKLRDWLISRQRFWGTPIPIVYCDNCGTVPVPEKDLPVKLPDDIKFFGVENPLKEDRRFTVTDCPKCKGLARRETDTMDTFVNSSWYFLRYLDPNNKKKIFDSDKAKSWMPVDTYIGGKEHATLHLIYARFYTKFLRDLGLLKIDEPFKKLFNQGILHAHDGRKMSKSFGNIILPETVSDKYGIDTARMFLVSLASPDKDINWSDEGIEGSLRFVMRVMKFAEDFSKKGKAVKMDGIQESKFNRLVKEYTSDLEGFRYNLAVIKLREIFEIIEQGTSKKEIGVFLRLLAPICPHISEELWEKIGGKGFVSLEDWPSYDGKKINAKLEEQEKRFDKTIEDIKNVLKILEEKGKKAKHVYLYVIPNELNLFDEKKVSSRIEKKVKVYAVNDPKKHDPEGKSRKVIPGRPGIYVE